MEAEWSEEDVSVLRSVVEVFVGVCVLGRCLVCNRRQEVLHELRVVMFVVCGCVVVCKWCGVMSRIVVGAVW